MEIPSDDIHFPRCLARVLGVVIDESRLSLEVSVVGTCFTEHVTIWAHYAFDTLKLDEPLDGA